MTHKIGDTVTYDTPLSGNGKYRGQILAIEGNVLKVNILEIIKPSSNPLSPQEIGDIDYVILDW